MKGSLGFANGDVESLGLAKAPLACGQREGPGPAPPGGHGPVGM